MLITNSITVMKVQSGEFNTIQVGEILSFTNLNVLFFERVVKDCFSSCSDDDYYKSSIDTQRSVPISDAAICRIPVTYKVEVSY